MSERDAELVQVLERALAEAEAAFRLDGSPANQRRIEKAWAAVRAARQDDRAPGRPLSGGGTA